jgi:hypothetical protein
MFFKRRKRDEPIAIGRSFQRKRSDRALEIAAVTEISPDGFGIPHVRYELTVEKPQSGGLYMAGTKVLSLSAFEAAYNEPVGDSVA